MPSCRIDDIKLLFDVRGNVFSVKNFSIPVEAAAITSSCISSDMSELLITGFRPESTFNIINDRIPRKPLPGVRHLKAPSY
jgi:hypothetical protein